MTIDEKRRKMVSSDLSVVKFQYKKNLSSAYSKENYWPSYKSVPDTEILIQRVDDIVSRVAVCCISKIQPTTEEEPEDIVLIAK